MIASFVVQLLIDGTISGFGIFYMEMQKDEAFVQANYSRTLLALPGNIQPGFFLCTGAFVSPLIQRLGFRVMGTIGSGMVGSGLALASFQKNIHLFNLFYGTLTGSGFGILMVCAIVSVNFYFERYRGIASGMAMAGSGIGCLTIPLIFSRLCDYIGWRRGLLVYSGFALLSAWLSVITFRPFVVAVFLNDEAGKQNGPLLSTSGTMINDASKKETQTKMPLIVTTVSVPEEEKNGNIAPCEPSKASHGLSRYADPVDSKKETPNDNSKETEQPKGSTWFHILRKKSDAYDAANEKQYINEFGSTVGSRLWKSTLAFKRTRAAPHSHYQSNVYHRKGTGSGDSHPYLLYGQQDAYIVYKNSLVADPFKRVDIFFSASLANLGPREANFLSPQSAGHLESRESGSPEGIFQSSSITGLPYLSTCTVHNLNQIGSSLSLKPTEEHRKPGGPGSIGCRMDNEDLLSPDNEDGEESAPGLTCTQRFRRQVVQLFDLNLFTNPRFLIILAVGITNQLAYFIPFVYLVDYSVKQGMGVDQAVVLSVILGSLHTVGRIVSGFVSNMSRLDTVYLSGLGTLAAALTNLALPTIIPKSFSAFAVYAALYGFFSALPVPMIHLLLVRFLGLERLTASYSNLNLTKALASVIGPMVAVSLVEYTGDPGHYFLVAGVCLLLSATVHLGLCRFPCTPPEDNEEAVDDRARCCFCLGLGASQDKAEEEPDAYFVDTGYSTD